MKTNFLSSLLLFFILAATSVSCNKDDDDTGTPAKDKREVKYEVTGNYTGKLTIVTSTNTGSSVAYNEVSVPWTKEITYPDNVMGVGIGGNGSNGVAGQTITLKIYSGGDLINTQNATANANGVLGFPTYAFVF